MLRLVVEGGWRVGGLKAGERIWRGRRMNIYPRIGKGHFKEYPWSKLLTRSSVGFDISGGFACTKEVISDFWGLLYLQRFLLSFHTGLASHSGRHDGAVEDKNITRPRLERKGKYRRKVLLTWSANDFLMRRKDGDVCLAYGEVYYIC